MLLWRWMRGGGCVPLYRTLPLLSAPVATALRRRLCHGRCRQHARRRSGPLLAGSLLASVTIDAELRDLDVPKLLRSTFDDVQPQLTGWQRLQSIYGRGEDGSYSPELGLVYRTVFNGSMWGLVLGGILGARMAHYNYVERNLATVYDSAYLARRHMADRIFMGFLRGGFLFGWRIAMFTSIFSFVWMSMSVYLHQMSVPSFIVAGFVTGFLFRLNQGIRAMMAAGTIAAMMGTVVGVVISAVCRVCGITMADFRYDLNLREYEKRLAKAEKADRKLYEKLATTESEE